MEGASRSNSDDGRVETDLCVIRLRHPTPALLNIARGRGSEEVKQLRQHVYRDLAVERR